MDSPTGRPPTPPLPPAPAPRSSLRERRRPPGTSPDAPDAPEPEPEPERAEPTADPDEDGITPEERELRLAAKLKWAREEEYRGPYASPSPRADFPRASTPPLASSRFSRFTSVPTTTPARWMRTRPST